MFFMTFSTNIFLLLFKSQIFYISSIYLHNQISEGNHVTKEPEHTFNVSV